MYGASHVQANHTLSLMNTVKSNTFFARYKGICIKGFCDWHSAQVHDIRQVTYRVQFRRWCYDKCVCGGVHCTNARGCADLEEILLQERSRLLISLHVLVFRARREGLEEVMTRVTNTQHHLGSTF